jgi:hypothetical protein
VVAPVAALWEPPDEPGAAPQAPQVPPVPRVNVRAEHSALPLHASQVAQPRALALVPSALAQLAPAQLVLPPSVLRREPRERPQALVALLAQLAARSAQVQRKPPLALQPSAAQLSLPPPSLLFPPWFLLRRPLQPVLVPRSKRELSPLRPRELNSSASFFP